MGSGWRVVGVVLLLAGAGACTPAQSQHVFAAGVASHSLHSQRSLSSRIMGEPGTVEATHALAEHSRWPDYQAELIQPGDDGWGWPVGEQADELDAPRPGR